MNCILVQRRKEFVEKNFLTLLMNFYNLFKVSENIISTLEKWPNCLVQFEDFSNDVCFDLLEIYRNKLFCFNDDIQGTGAVIVSGFMNAVKLSGLEMKKHKIVFLGAGSAAIGVASEISLIHFI
jgi:malic enzyme